MVVLDAQFLKGKLAPVSNLTLSALKVEQDEQISKVLLICMCFMPFNIMLFRPEKTFF